MKTKQPRKQRLARYNAPLHRRRVEMSAPIDNALRLKQEANNVFYPRSMPVRVGDTVIIVRGEGRVKSGEQKGHKISKIDRRKRKLYLENHTYFKSDGTELQRPIDPSNVVIINPDWTDLKRRKILDRINESIDDEKLMEQIEEVEEKHEKEVAPSEEKSEESKKEVAPSEEKSEESENVVKYEDMKVTELKEVLKEKSLPVSGKKADLIERIRESENQ